MLDIMQQLYESEINCSISSFWDGGFTWGLGDDHNGWQAGGEADTFADAAAKLAEAARRHYPDSDFAKKR
jgi:hypothetical protein